MKKYSHWLVIDFTEKDENEAVELIRSLIEYQKEHGAEIELYHRDSGTFEHIFRVECTQNYNELDLPCNAGFNSFYRLQRKPSNVYKGRSFKEYIHKMSKKLDI